MANIILLIIFCLLMVSASGVFGGCVNMWDAKPTDREICSVQTSSGQPCLIPFNYNNDTYYTCIITGPNNPLNMPQCLTTANTWSFCQVPTDAVITYVTTRKAGTINQNGASLNGETLVWIYGYRFAPNMFSFTPSPMTSNKVLLESSTSSYECEIHPDKVTKTQITCWTPASIEEGTYVIRVYVNNNLIPFYQYIRQSQAIINVNSGSTPIINSIVPSRGIPGSFVAVNGKFNTDCYSRDINTCGDDAGARISRVYFGPQLCDIVNPLTLDVYDNITTNYLKCKLQGSTIGIFNASMIVSEDNGRSNADSKTYLVTPDELIYNFQTYAEITSITPNAGSTEGSTKVQITGKYLYHSDDIPAIIQVSGSRCNVVSFDNTNELSSKITCETQPSQASSTDYIGNRGINVIRDNIYTQFSSLGSTSPSVNAQTSWLDVASYQDTNKSDVTIWLNGFLAPSKSSDYLFSVSTNGAAKLYLSTDSSSANKVLVGSYDPSTSSSVSLTKSLKGGNMYYLQAIASKTGGGLNLNINAKMYDTTLNGKTSSMIKTEVQEVEIVSTIIPEANVFDYSGVQVGNGTAEIQSLKIISALPNDFVLNFAGANTNSIPYGASASVVQKELNDLPTLASEGVTVTAETTSDGGILYKITFTLNTGDVPDITEVTGNVVSTNIETVKGVPTQAKFQLNINNAITNLFDINNDQISTIKDAIEEVFRIRCPLSIQTKIPSTTFAVFDFESECQYTEQPLSLTAFCGKCARKNSNSLFWNVNSPMSFNQLCFAYKIVSPIEQIGITVFLDGDSSIQRNAYISVNTIADNQWHYTCIDMYQGLLKNWQTSSIVYPTYRITLIGAWIYPVVQDLYLDVVSIKNSVPSKIDDASLLTRRIFPQLQMVYNSLTVTRDTVNKKLTVSYRPNNCSINQNPITVRQTVSNQPVASVQSSATGPVLGTFDLKWNSSTITSISSSTSDKILRNLLQSIEGMGQLNVIRSKDCAGFKWRVEWVDGGNKLPLNIVSSSLSGNKVNISVQTTVDGGVEYYPIQGDMLRTSHNAPQFSININGIPSKCSTDCSYQWSSSLTPVVNNIDTTNLASIKIYGSGFDSTTLSNNIVYIGNTLCTINTATSTVLNCSPGQGPVGTYNFKVYVLPNGLAKMNSAATFTFNLNANSIAPTVSGTGGGVKLNITGNGFSSQTIVKIDGNLCPIKSFTYTFIQCVVPSNIATSNKLVNIVVVDGSYTFMLPQQLQYDYVNTPLVTNVSKTTKLNVLGGETITITGTNFNTQYNLVYFGNEPAIVQSFTNTQIIVISPSLQPGLYDLIIPSGSVGYAMSQYKLEYTLYVSSFTPNSGSIRGGAIVTVYGDGFSNNCSQNSVNFGETNCKVLDCTNQWIKCQTKNANKIYTIDNNGYDQYYGRGYAWSIPFININKGDYIQWTWSAPGTISNINYAVQQVADPTSTTATGFDSGTPRPTGSFTYQFNTMGTYYYWSGYVDSNSMISFRGVINVGQAVDRDLTIDVTVNGFKAQKCNFPFSYKSTNYSSCTSIDFGYNWCSPSSIYKEQSLNCSPLSQPSADSCPGNTINLASCSLSNPSSIYDFKFTTCNIASISSISTSNGTAGTSITISGSGFSSNSCENKVLIGDNYECRIVSSSNNQIVCQIDSNSGLIPGINYKIEVQLKNFGFALQNKFYSFNFFPIINSITPTIGSSAGGTKITIYGDGFTDNTVIVLSGLSYSKLNANITYNQISFNTKVSAVGIGAITIFVNGIQSVCSSNCDYELSSQIAPTLSSASPLSVFNETTITLSGSKFGTDSSKINVKIGNQICNVITVIGNQITCSVIGLTVGLQSVMVNLNGVGNAISSSNIQINGVATIKSISPSSGSIYGGTVLTIDGNGFDNIQNTQVKIGTKLCTISSVTTTKVTCITPDNSAGTYAITISSFGVTFPSSSFSYDSLSTPSVTQVSPTSGTDGATITISGSGFGTSLSDVSILIGNSVCSVQTVNSNQITCITGTNAAGSYPIQVQVNSFGYSNKNIKFTYDLAVNTMTPQEGSFGGGLEISLTGSGFAALNTSISICSKSCKITTYSGTSQVSCLAPSQTYSNSDSVCSLIVNVNGSSVTKTFTYKTSLTPTLTNVSPVKGGTGGGTLITITGNGFPIDKSKVKVTIADSECTIATISSTIITCNTGSYSSSSIVAPVLVFIQNNGFASNVNNVQFQYIDLWSSKFTWGGKNIPQEGELVVVGPGQTIYLDTVSPILKGVIIQGGALIFDDNQDVHLKAEYIVISDKGTLQVGTESSPFVHKATITMYGSLRSIELPIFGAKVLALRNGTLDLHGAPVGVTWTYLSATAAAKSSQIQLVDSVKWSIGSKIVIATTSDKFSQGENEMRTITAISIDGRTLTLDSPLNFEHLSVKRSNSGVDVSIRAEVGLLSRNVVFNAINDNSWNSLRSAKACPDGFNPGEFATMTCFLGRYGDEIGSDEFGATIMINAAQANKIGSENVIARISNVELFHVGQAFRLGRYPIHFHMIGDSPSSYVRECGMYESFNRAVNVHATNYVTIEKNVIYNIMGGAFFLEDGIEIGNVFQYNLAVFVKTSSSLLNEDVTPAAFWATNPNNTWQHNAVAGGTHFGFWYRILDNPDGPSFTPTYCPKKIPFGKFFNNSVHSVGRFGLWIFPGYTPTISGSCNDKRGSPARFDNFLSYRNDKGSEWVMSSNIQFRNFVAFDNSASGIETKSNVFHQDPNTDYSAYFYNETTGSLVADSIIIGNSDPNALTSITNRGLVVAWERGILIKNIKFINFPDSNSFAIGATEITGRCTFGCGGWTTHFTGLSFSNVQYKTLHRWSWDLVYRDLDGSLTGGVNNVVVSATNITKGDTRCKVSNEYFQGAVCTNTIDWIRFAFNNYKPDLPVFIDIENSRGDIDMGPSLKKRLTHPFGFMVSLEANQTYKIDFEQALYPTNISYTGTFYSIKPNEFLIIKHKMNKKPDQVVVYNSLASESFTPLSIESNNNGDWYWENSTRTLSYIIHNKQGRKPFLDAVLNFNAKKCRFVNCQLPTQPALRLPATKRPSTAIFWSNITTWQSAYIISQGKSLTTASLPKDLDSIKIPDGVWVVVDCVLPTLTRIQIDGVLEFDDSLDNTLVVDEIFINGGQLIIGWENQPFQHNVEILLRGTKASIELILPNGFDSMGSKAIGVYGGLDLHGIPRQPSWTQLALTAYAGSNQIKLIEPVDWKIGEELVISTTSYAPFQTETFQIIGISADKYTLTLNASLVYDHISASESFANGKSYKIAAGVGLLTRNIKITGDEYQNQFNDLFGSRIIVSDYSDYVYPEGSNTPITVYYKGFARVSDVEFKHFGQFSRNDEDDFKYGILFSNLGNYDTTRPSYLRNCAFHNGFSAAVGIRNSASLPIENNVMHHSIEFAVRIDGHSNIIRKNLIVLVVWSPTYLTNDAPFSIKYWGAIDIKEAESAVIQDNLIAGSQRVGLNYRGSPCPGKSLVAGYNHSISGNSIYGSLAGASIFPPFAFSLDCIMMSDFIIYKSIYVGLYYQATANFIADSNTLIDNQINIFPQVFSPSSVSHVFVDKSITISNNLIIGTSPSFNCDKDIPPKDLNLQYSSKAASYGAKNEGKIGVVWANFIDGSNGAPFKPWYGVMSYNYINGLSTLNNNTFAHFKKSCFESVDAVITTSKNNDDGQMPVVIKNTIFYDVDNSSKVFLHRPNINKINPSDCVDMDCDGLKKNLLTDVDGSFLGSPGTVISQSEYGWGDQSRGLGDFRIPKEVLVDSNGQMMKPSSVYTYPGIVRDQNLCTYKDAWQAYECHGLEYKMLVIESMDNDTESRRLSPVAILSDNKYLDLINGPQDHGWCFGYTCQKRISTFLALVVANKHYDIFLSSTPPNKLRFRILNANSTFKIRLSMTYSTSNNVNVYKNIALVDPTNSDRSTGSLILKDPQGYTNQYMPAIGDAPGTNFLDRANKKIYFSIDGSDYIDLIVSPEIFLTFGVKATTADAFFNSATLVSNIATLLGVPTSMIRRVEIVKETGSISRVLRQAINKISQFKVIISSDPPVTSDSLLSQASLNQIGNVTSDTAGRFYFGDLQDAASKMNLTIVSLSVQISNSTTELQEVGGIRILQDVGNCRAQSPCEIQPIIQLVDKNNQPINVVQLGNQLVVNVTIFNGTNSIINQYQSSFDINGTAKFSTLGFYNEANGISVRYTLQAQASVKMSSIFKVTSGVFNIITPIFSLAQDEAEVAVKEGKEFSVNFYLVDKISNVAIPNPGYKGQTFTACIDIYSLSSWQPSNANIQTSAKCVPLKLSTNRFTFTNLTLNTKGMFILQVTAKSNDNQFNINKTSNNIRVFSSNLTDNSNYYNNLQIKFDGTFVESEKTQYIASVYNYFLKMYNVELIGTISCYAGSIMFVAGIDGSDPNFNAIVSNGTVSETQQIIPGHSLLWFSLGSFEVSKSSSSSSSSSINSSPSSSNGATIGAILGTIGGVAVLGLIAIGSLLAYRHYKAKKPKVLQTQSDSKTRINSGKRLLNDTAHDHLENESVTITRPNTITHMSELNRIKTPECLFYGENTTHPPIQTMNNYDYLN